ncbi:MAG: hypothetical protein SGPRY_001326 [Prymnesium sp.]
MTSQEREPITEGEVYSRPKTIMRDGAAPCMALTALLLGVVVVGSTAVGISLAAFNPSPEANATTSSPIKKSTPEEHRKLLPDAAGQEWTFRSENLSEDVWQVKSSFSWADAAEGLANGSLGTRLNEQLSLSPHPSFYWETPPLTSATAATTPFQFVTVRAHSLEGLRADSTPFAKQLTGCVGDARSFANIGGDAQLVSPCSPLDGLVPSSHAHLAAFVRSSSAQQQRTFWRELGSTVQRTLRARGHLPTWVSTAGDGVPWLHVRLDSQPKYYKYSPFQQFVSVSRRLGFRRAAKLQSV